MNLSRPADCGFAPRRFRLRPTPQTAQGTLTTSSRLIRESLHRKSLSSARQRTLLGRVLGLSDNDVLAVQHLARAGRMTPSELGRELGLTSGGTTALIQRLERAGHLTREPHPTDRRSVRITLTPELGRRATEALAPMVEAIDALANELPSEQREAVARFLEGVATISEQHADELARRASGGDGAAARDLVFADVWV